MYETYRLEITENKQVISVEDGGVTHSYVVDADPEIQIIEILDRGLMGPPGPPGSAVGDIDLGTFN